MAKMGEGRSGSGPGRRRGGPRLRPAVGAIVFDGKGRLLVGRRNDSARPHWQLPQGGIRRGERSEDAVVREILEEVGTSNVQILGVLPRRTRYVWSGPSATSPADSGPPVVESNDYDGQSHIWFVVRLDGAIEEERASEEFAEFAWIDPDELLSETHPIRRATYLEVQAMLREWLAERGLA